VLELESFDRASHDPPWFRNQAAPLTSWHCRMGRMTPIRAGAKARDAVTSPLALPVGRATFTGSG
jgi:hypothetical protein